MLTTNIIHTGNCLEILPTIPSGSVDTVITSPPYFQQREYGGDGIGNESHEKDYLDNLLAIFGECVRIIKSTGSVVVNLGDKYQQGSLSLLPYKFAIAAAERFSVRLINNVTWVKVNPTPRQDKRKLVQAAEPFFIFVKSNDYYFDIDGYMEHLDILKQPKPKTVNGNGMGKRYFELLEESDLSQAEKTKAQLELTKVIQEVREGKIQSFRMKIRNIHAQPFGGQDGGRKIHLERDGFTIIRILGKTMKKDVIESPVETIKGNQHPAVYPLYVIQQLLKLLTPKYGVVLDPFSGSGTTCLAAKMLQREYIGIEIYSEYAEYSRARLAEFSETTQTEMFIL